MRIDLSKKSVFMLTNYLIVLRAGSYIESQPIIYAHNNDDLEELILFLNGQLKNTAKKFVGCLEQSTQLHKIDSTRKIIFSYNSYSYNKTKRPLMFFLKFRPDAKYDK